MKSERFEIQEFLSCLVDQVAVRTADLVEERLEAGRAGEDEAGDAVLDVAGAAAFLKIGQSTIYKAAASGGLASVKLGGRLVFRRADLLAYLEAHRRGDEIVLELAKAARKGE